MSEKYSPQGEILEYANHVVDRFGLADGIQLNTRVESAIYNEESGHYQVSLGDGSAVTARYVVMATGCLSVPNFPDIDGLDTFAGEIHITARSCAAGTTMSRFPRPRTTTPSVIISFLPCARMSACAKYVFTSGAVSKRSA